MFQVLLFRVCLVKALTSPQPDFTVENDNINKFSKSEKSRHFRPRGQSGMREGEGLGAYPPPCQWARHGACPRKPPHVRGS